MTETRALKTLVCIELRPDSKSHYKKVGAGGVCEAETTAALKKRLAGGSFQTVNQAPQEPISEQSEKISRGRSGRVTVG